MILTPQYGFRSQCCYAPIKLGRKKVRNTTLKIDIWVCTKCGKRDCSLVEYNKDRPLKTSVKKPIFATSFKEEEPT